MRPHIPNWFYLVALMAIILVGGCSKSERTLTVDGEEDVFKAKHPKFSGERHGDGSVKVRIFGIVVEPGGETGYKPVSNATLRFEPSAQFSDSFNRAINIKSDAGGAFDFEAEVGAAVMIGGTDDGKVYQTTRARLIIEKSEFAPAAVLIDYNMPKLRIVMRPVEPKESGRDKLIASPEAPAPR
jgi:hypothetical protein